MWQNWKEGITSKSGSADMLEAIRFKNLNLSFRKIIYKMPRRYFGFYILCLQNHHPAINMLCLLENQSHIELF